MKLPQETLLQLVNAARAAAEKSYSPYSSFPVGAAILTTDGKIFSGCNIENASYGLTTCAERTAIVKAISELGQLSLSAVVVYTPTNSATLPCGSCRQLINEFGSTATIYSASLTGEEYVGTLDQLLPRAFGPKDLL